MAHATFGQYNLVFVYGTLKRGFTNYERYMKPAIDKGKALLCASECRTHTRYPMHVVGERCVPVVYDKADVGHQIRGELYFVDNDVLEALDMLEGVHLSFYYRTVSIRLSMCGDPYPVTRHITVDQHRLSVFASTAGMFLRRNLTFHLPYIVMYICRIVLKLRDLSSRLQTWRITTKLHTEATKRAVVKIRKSLTQQQGTQLAKRYNKL